MTTKLSEQIASLLHNYEKRRKANVSLLLAAALVIGGTGIGMSMPAATATPEVICGLDEHTHGDACYAENSVLTCDQEEDETHVHDDNCYEAETVLTCTETEHAHTSECYEQGGVLNAQTSDRMRVEVSYDAGVIPQNTYLTAKKLESEAAVTAETKLTEELQEQDAEAVVTQVYDLSLQNDNHEVEPDGTVKVQLTFAEPVAADAEGQDVEWQLYHLSEDEELENLTKESTTSIYTNSENEVTGIAFETGSFSEYMVAGVAVNITDGVSNENINANLDSDSELNADANTGSGEDADIDDNDSEPDGIQDDSEYPAQNFEDSANGITVRVTADAGALPANTVMEVSTVDDQDILDAAINAVQAEGAEAQAVDITFYNEEGEEIEPLSGIRVTMKADAIAESEGVSVVHVEDAQNAAVVPQTSMQVLTDEELPANDEVVFDSDSFSAYVLVYTVDFYFGDYEYHLQGGESMMLSELLEKLQIQKNKAGDILTVEDIQDVQFSDDALVTFTKIDDGTDWTIESLKAFASEEVLTLVLFDGTTVEVRVTDDQGELDLAPFLRNVTIEIEGKEVSGNNWTIRENQSYNMTLHFRENGLLQYVEDDTPMVFQLPEGMYIENTSQTFSVFVNDGSQTYEIKDNHLTVNPDTREVTVVWNTGDVNFEKMTYSSTQPLTISLKGTIDADKGELKFSDTVKKEITKDTSHNASINKTGNYDAEAKQITYTLTIHSEGTSKNIKVSDHMNIDGTVLQFVPGSVQINGVDVQGVQESNNGFDYVISEMQDGDTVTITYKADVKISDLKQNGNLQFSETGNTATLTVDRDKNPNDNTSSYHESNINFSSLSKDATSISGEKKNDADEKYKTVTWHISANSEKLVPLTHITDTIQTSSQERMKYSGEGITISVKHTDGTLSTRNLNWNDKSNADSEGWVDKTDTQWIYHPPKDEIAAYDITYTTDVSIENLHADIAIYNAVEDDYNSTSGQGTVGPNDNDKLTVSKKATAASDEYITWKISVNVPSTGYESLVIEDILPHKYTTKHLYDSILMDSIQVKGLDGTECFTTEEVKSAVEWIDGTGYIYETSAIKFVFFKNNADKNAYDNGIADKSTGLNASTNEGNRTLVIQLTTKNNPELLEAAKNAGYATDLSNHQNQVNVTADKDTQTDTDTVVITESEISKIGSESTAKVVDGKSYRIYRYDIVLKNVHEDNVSLTDIFDTDLLSLYRGTDYEKNLQIMGGNQWDQTDKSTNSGITFTETNDGIRIDISKFPRLNEEEGTFYSHYRIIYYLLLEDEETIMANAAANDGTAKIHNKVQWDDKTSEVDLEYTYEGLKKELTAYNAADRKASYTLTINPQKQKLNGGHPMELSDSYINLLIDLSSIKIQTDPNAENISYENKSGILIFKNIPDCTSVSISYDAKILASDGEIFRNDAFLEGYSDYSEKTYSFQADADSSTAMQHIWLYKYAEGDMLIPLQGAKFYFTKENGEPYNYVDKNEPIVFTSDENGLVEIKLANHDFAGGLQEDTWYYLKEFEAPKGYQCDSSIIKFKIVSDKGKQNIKENVFYLNNILNVSNEPVSEVEITLKKVDNLNSENLLGGATFDLYDSDYLDANGKVNESAEKLKSSLSTAVDGEKKGIVSLGKLETGVYYLVETKAPDSYVLEENPIKLTVENNKVTVLQRTASKEFSVTEQESTITVTNSAGYELPHTGGTGTKIITITGITLMAAALFLEMRRRLFAERRRKRIRH